MIRILFAPWSMSVSLCWSLLPQIFPRHVLACLTEEGGPLQQLAAEGSVGLSTLARCPAGGVPRDINRLATSHAEVGGEVGGLEGESYDSLDVGRKILNCIRGMVMCTLAILSESCTM